MDFHCGLPSFVVYHFNLFCICALRRFRYPQLLRASRRFRCAALDALPRYASFCFIANNSDLRWQLVLMPAER